MKVALITAGTRGDTQPFLALGRGLIDAGHEATLYAAPDFERVAAAHGLGFHAVGQPIEAWLARSAKAMRNPIRVASKFTGELIAEINRQVTQLQACMREGDADVILGASLMFGAGTMAELHGVPYRHVLFTPQALPSEEHGPPIIPWTPTSALANRFYWWIQVKAFNVLIRRELNRHRRELGLEPVRSAYDYLVGRGVLVASEPALAGLPQLPIDTTQTGCWPLPAGDDVLPDELAAFLEAGDPPIFVGFGSMTDDRPDETTRMFVDVTRELGMRLVVQAGWAGLGSTGSDHVLTVGPLPHDLVLPHMAAMVHHGGAGTTTAAARAGIPQLIVPHLLDQFYWGERIRRLAVGPRPLPRSKLRADRLREALRELVATPDMRDRAEALGLKIEAENNVPRTVDLLEQIVRLSSSGERRSGWRRT